VNALEPLLDVLEDLRKNKWFKSEELGETTMNIGILKSGEAGNIVPGLAEAQILFRIVTTPEEILEIVK
jgi:metal-dependent amidase/aminoacylase/carboxypeptidase family protein